MITQSTEEKAEGGQEEPEIFEWGDDEYEVDEIGFDPYGEDEFIVDFPSSDNSHVVRIEDNGDLSCTCPDYKFRRAKLGEDCKHMGFTREALTDGGEEEEELDLDNLPDFEDYKTTRSPDEEEEESGWEMKEAPENTIHLEITDPELIQDIEEVFSQRRDELNEAQSKLESRVDELLRELQKAETQLDRVEEKLAAYNAALESLGTSPEDEG